MGQQAIIIVALASLLVGISVTGFMGVWDYSNETTATLFEREQALNVSRSGVNLAVSQLRQQKSWRAGYTNLATAGGTVTVGIVDLGLDTVRITSVGTINNRTHTTVVDAKLSSIFPTVESALTVFGDSVHVSSSGKSFLIDGSDYRIDGTKSANPSVHGLGVQSGESAQDVITQLETQSGGSIAENVQGKGGAPSVGTFNTSNLNDLHQFYKDRATIILPAGKYASNTVIGSLERPEILYVPGDLEWSGTIIGTGILVVDGQLIMKGNIEWRGIVLAMSGDVTLELGGSGNPSILGTAWIGNKDPNKVTDVKVNGNPSIRYSYELLMTVLGNLGLLQVEMLRYYE